MSKRTLWLCTKDELRDYVRPIWRGERVDCDDCAFLQDSLNPLRWHKKEDFDRIVVVSWPGVDDIREILKHQPGVPWYDTEGRQIAYSPQGIRVYGFARSVESVKINIGDMVFTSSHDPRPFRPGDVVRLKSGGPTMTVAVIDGDHASLRWFNDRYQVDSVRFPVAVLELAK